MRNFTVKMNTHIPKSLPDASGFSFVLASAGTQERINEESQNVTSFFFLFYVFPTYLYPRPMLYEKHIQLKYLLWVYPTSTNLTFWPFQFLSSGSEHQKHIFNCRPNVVSKIHREINIDTYFNIVSLIMMSFDVYYPQKRATFVIRK